MKMNGLIATLCLVGCMTTGLCSAQAPAGDRKAQEKSEEGLKKVIHALYKTMASGKLDDQEKALKALLPERKDIEYLFPKHADKIWPLLEQGLKEFVKKTPAVAKELTRHGPIEGIKLRDLRTDPQAKKTSAKLLAMIPKDVPLYNYSLSFASAGSGGGTYLYVNGRWLFIKDFDSFHELIEELENRK